MSFFSFLSLCYCFLYIVNAECWTHCTEKKKTIIKPKTLCSFVFTFLHTFYQSMECQVFILLRSIKKSISASTLCYLFAAISAWLELVGWHSNEPRKGQMDGQYLRIPYDIELIAISPWFFFSMTFFMHHIPCNKIFTHLTYAWMNQYVWIKE